MNWQQAITHCHNQADPFAVATVISTTGSTPRKGSAKMVVTAETTHDTIGGGQLELKVTEAAREMLKSPVPSQKIDHFPLATKAGQCCGGSVSVLIESFPVTAMRLAVFGAGHVASALMQVLAQCDARIEWVDSRSEMFPAEVSANVQTVCLEDPVEIIRELTDTHRAVIVTHDHALDYHLAYALLTETEIDYVGLIGSDTKAKRFYTRLEKDGVSEADRQRCICPIGLPDVKGKLPMEIAVSIAAQVLSLDPVKASEIKPDLSWKEIRQAFSDA
jgi:xanthine dehydrogenase accessory factor